MHFFSILFILLLIVLGVGPLEGWEVESESESE